MVQKKAFPMLNERALCGKISHTFTYSQLFLLKIALKRNFGKFITAFVIPSLLLLHMPLNYKRPFRLLLIPHRVMVFSLRIK
jgi:hypothetical protein